MIVLSLFTSFFSAIASTGEIQSSHSELSSMDKALDSGVQAVGEAASHAETVFSWGGYFQAIGLMCLLLAALWGAVWLVRRYGKFNFIPSPVALPRDALRMEAQLPLGAKKGLAVIKFLDRRLLLGITEKNIVLLKDTGIYNERDAQEFEQLLKGAEQHDSETT